MILEDVDLADIYYFALFANESLTHEKNVSLNSRRRSRKFIFFPRNSQKL